MRWERRQWFSTKPLERLESSAIHQQTLWFISMAANKKLPGWTKMDYPSRSLFWSRFTASACTHTTEEHSVLNPVDSFDCIWSQNVNSTAQKDKFGETRVGYISPERVWSRFHCCIIQRQAFCDSVVEPEQQISLFPSVMRLFFLTAWNHNVLILVRCWSAVLKETCASSYCSFNHLASRSFQTWHAGPRTPRGGIHSGFTANDLEQRFVWAEWLSKWGDPRTASEEKRGWVPMARAIHTHAPHA